MTLPITEKEARLAAEREADRVVRFTAAQKWPVLRDAFWETERKFLWQARWAAERAAAEQEKKP